MKISWQTGVGQVDNCHIFKRELKQRIKTNYKLGKGLIVLIWFEEVWIKTMWGSGMCKFLM